MGIRDKPIAPGSPWQNACAERLIGSMRRELIDHVVVLGEGICGGCCNAMRAITTKSERTDRWTKMRHFLARFSGSDASCRMRYSAAFITCACESEFSVHTGGCCGLR